MSGTITDTIKQKIQEVLHVSAENLKDSDKLREDLGADSLDLAEMVFMLEDSFNMTTTDDELREIETVGQMINYVQQKVGGG